MKNFRKGMNQAAGGVFTAMFGLGGFLIFGALIISSVDTTAEGVNQVANGIKTAFTKTVEAVVEEATA